MRKLSFILFLISLLAAGVWNGQPGGAYAESANNCASVADIPSGDCNVLADLYNTTNGAGWTNKSGWLSSNTACSWYGVTCAGGRVTQLRLQANNLNGAIPASLGNLTQLNWLELHDNGLTGAIPAQLGSLTALTELSLYRNSLSGSIPPQLGNLPNLNALRLGFNQLTGSVPPQLGNLTTLTILGLDSNGLSGTLPPELGNLTNLTLLNLDRNQFSGSIPTSFGNFPNMWRLWLENNRLSGELPAQLGNLTALRHLSVQNNALSGVIPASYNSLTQLQSNNTRFGYNRLTASNSSLIDNRNPAWPQTQTVAPTNVQAAAQSSSAVQVTWTPIAYTGDGGHYEVSYATTSGGPYTVHGVTANKSANSYTVTGLSSGSTYYFVVRTRTPAHGDQQNELLSDYSQQASANTGSFTCSGVSGIPAGQCEALRTFYEATGGPTWTNRSGWLVTNTPCSWFGVTCTGGNVTALRMPANGLAGPLPTALADLPNLTVVELPHNALSEPIPVQLASLSALTELSLQNNQLSGAIPAQLGNLSNLTALRLGSNQLSGPIPPELGNLANLTILGLDKNALSGAIPAQLGNLSKLELFNLDTNRLTGAIPTTFGNFPNMWRLWLENNQLSGTLPTQLGNLTLLRQFSVRNNALSGAIPTSYQNLTLLNSSYTHFGYNLFTASNSNWINSRDPDWPKTQTAPVSALQATAQSPNSIQLTWTPIAYTGDGGYYEVRSSTTAGGPYTVQGVTPNKSANSFTVTGLTPATTYFFVVRTYTPAHGAQQNNLWSGFSAEVSTATPAETAPTAPQIISQAVTNALRGQPYAYSVTATGSVPLTFALQQGPPGMTINASSGLISWTPTTLGAVNVTVRVSNAVGNDAQSFTITVNETPKIVSNPVTVAVLNQPYAYDVDADGSPPPTFSLDEAPGGMTINAGGLIAWTPAATGLVSVTVRATNAFGSDRQSFAINVSEMVEQTSPQITSTPVTAATVGQPYRYDVIAAGAPPPQFVLLAAPEGMVINATTGSISWLPERSGSFEVTVRATNNAGNIQQSFTVTVTEPAAGDAYEDDDDCSRATPISTDGAAQLRNFHSPADVDWVQFTAQANKTYIIEVKNIGPRADAVVALYDTCNQPPRGADNNAFGSTVRLEWDATRSGDYFIKLQPFDPDFAGPGADYQVSVTLDTVPPSTPKNPRCTAVGGQTLGIQWKRNPERDVRAYQISFRRADGGDSGLWDIAGATTTYHESAPGELQLNTLYHVRLRAIDFSGNVSPPSGELDCRIVPGPPPTAPSFTIDQPTAGALYTTSAERLTVSGIAQSPEAGLSRANVRNTTQDAEGWDYSLAGNTSPFRVKDLPLALGDNLVQVSVFNEVGVSSQRTLTVRRQGNVAGAVIIIAGHNETFGLQTNIYNAANRAYRIFRSAGYSAADIHYLAPVGQDATGDGAVDTAGEVNPAAVQAAVTEWARGRVGPERPLFLYLIDHGLADKFCASGCGAGGSFTPAQLDSWLRTLEAATGLQEVTIVIEACQSGSFLDRHQGDVANSLSKAGRVVITSTGRENNAYASAQGAYFSDAFFSCVADSNNLKVCFDQAVAAVEATGVNQTPWLDDNGDGFYNANDGVVASARVVTRFFSSVRPRIVSVEVEQTGVNGVLRAQVEEGAEEVELVWAAVYPPSFVEPDEVTLNLNVPTVRLEAIEDEPGRYSFHYVNGFAEEGDYRIVFYAQDRNGIHAVPRREGQLDTLFLPLIQQGP
jgi:Leucine-rich repeat (LRR) protein